MKDKILALLLQAEDFISGEEMSESLGVSRTAIWKNIKKIKEEGYIIESITNKGYRIIEYPNKLIKEELKYFLREARFDWDIFVYDKIDSTNTEAKRQGANEKLSSALFISEEQTAGKGRRGKIWESKEGENIYMSLLIRPDIHPQNASKLTLLAGLAVNQVISNNLEINSAIKWPNDIVINKKKVCGILTEMSSEIDYINYVIIGIGINVNHNSFSSEVSDIATSLDREGGQTYSRKELITQIVTSFEKLYIQFLENENLEFCIEEYNNSCINVKSDVKIVMKDKEIIGKALRVNSEGVLVVKKSDGEIITVNSGEVSVRGLYGYTD